jgi:hypothetical protein
MKIKAVGAAIALVVGLTFAGAVSADAANVNPSGSGTAARQAIAPANSVNGSSVVDGSLYCADFAVGLCDWMLSAPNGSITEASLNAALKIKVNQLAVAGPQGPAGAVGPQGPAGPAGASAILSVTADTMVSNRNDTATDGTVWAKDTMTRTLTVVRQHATKATDCGAGAVKCWFYTGTIKDNGTFTTVAGAHGPNSTTPINGTVNGTVNGVYEIEFNATSDLPNSTTVPSVVTGSSPTTSDWMKQAFPAGTLFYGFNGVKYTWAYFAPVTGENHVQTNTGNTGDILGVCQPAGSC